jgi:hypothetical protein
MKVFGWTNSFRGCTETIIGLRKGTQLGTEITYRFLPQDHITDILVPSRQRGRQLRVELARTWTIRRALSDLQVDEELADHFFAK